MVLAIGSALAFAVYGNDSLRTVDAQSATKSLSGSPVVPMAGTPAIGPGGLGEWEYLGPDRGGPTGFVAYAPQGAGVAYAVSRAGDVFRSIDAGLTWSFLSHIPLRDAKLALSADDAQLMYAYSTASQPFEDVQSKLMMSADGGVTWEEKRLAYPRLEWGFEIHAVSLVPGQPGVVWAVGRNGLMRSADGATSWSLVYSHGGPTECRGLEISVDTASVYTVCRTQGWNVIRAPIDGSGWTQLTQWNNPDASLATLAMSRSNPATLYVATFGDPSVWADYTLMQVLRSTDGGQSWQVRFQKGPGDPIAAAIPGDFETWCDSPGFNRNLTSPAVHVAVDPANPNSLWIAGFEMFRSDDGGATFGRAFSRAATEYDVSTNTHAGVRGSTGFAFLAFAPGYNGVDRQTLLAADGTGLRHTANARAAVQTAQVIACQNSAGSPAVAWTRSNNGLSASRLVHGDAGPNGEVAATGPDVGIGLSDGSGASAWAYPTIAHNIFAGQISLDPAAGIDRFVSSSSFMLTHWQWNGSVGQWRVDQRYIPTVNPPGYTSGEEGTSQYFHPWSFIRFERDPRNSDRIVASSSDGVFETRNGGGLWQLVSPSAPVITVGIRRDGGITAVTDNFFLLMQSAGGSSPWEMRDLDGCLLSSGNCTAKQVRINSFVAHPDPASTLTYATVQAHADSDGYVIPKLWSSGDGRVWSGVDRPTEPGSLPYFHGDMSLAIDPDNPAIQFAGTPRGLWISEDGGRTWTGAATPFPGTAISRLKFVRLANGSRRLFAFTYGRGAWAANVAPSTTFADVPTYYWGHSFIGRLFQAGITSGCAIGPLRFCPEQQVTRDQMAVFLLRAKYGSAYGPPVATGIFADVPVGYWAAAWVEQLRAEGITSGCSASPLHYCPAAEVTRDQMAVFLLRAKHGSSYQPPAATGVFEDVPQNHWAAAWIEQLAREGVTGGCSATPRLYCPTAAVTRDQMAVFLVRAYGL